MSKLPYCKIQLNNQLVKSICNMNNNKDFSDLFIKYGTFAEDDDDDELYINNGTEAVRFCTATEASTNKKVICKVFDPSALQEEDKGEDSVQESRWYRQLSLLREALILNSLNHPAIVKFKGLDLYNTKIKFDDFNEKEYQPNPIIFLEYFKNKSIQSHIRSSHLNLPPVKRQICILGISAALRFLHSQQILHRSINPNSIWLDDNFYPKIFDFSTSREFDIKHDKPKTVLRDDAAYYQAPELFVPNYSLYNEKVDVFALGRMIYLLVTGVEPFKLKTDPSKKLSPVYLKTKVIDGTFPVLPEGMSKEYKELFEKCFSPNPSERPTASFIFEVISKNKCFLIDGITSKQDLQEIDNYIQSIEQFEKKNQVSTNLFCVNFK